MIHKACMPVYMNSGKIVAGGRDGWTSKVLQEVLADLKIEKKCLTKTQDFIVSIYKHLVLQ